MRWLERFRWLKRMDRDLREEIAQHLDEKTDALIAEGMSREQAQRAARVAFGNPMLVAERGREVWQWNGLRSLWADTKLAVRRLLQAPIFTVTSVVTLALGIGANTGVFTLMHALLLEDLPVPEPARLVRIALDVRSALGAAQDLPLNLSLLQSIERHARSLNGVFGWSPYDFVLREETGLHVYTGAVVSGNSFQVLGIAPAAGRLLRPEDDRKGGGPDGWAAVISYRFWQQHYRGDPAAIGRRVTLSNHSVTIVGVAPESFEGVFVAMRPDFYLPLEYEPVMRGADSVLHMPGNLWLTTWARLKPGIEVSAAAAEMRALYQPAMEETLPPAVRHSPVVEHSTFALRAGSTGWSNLRAQYARPLLLLQALVGVVLLVCCVNLAGLALAQAATREHEFAIRAALGASRGRLMQGPLLESLLLALAGALPATGFAWAIDRYLLRFLADPRASASLRVRPEAATLLLTAGCAVGCAVLFGIGPAWLASGSTLEPALRRKGQRGRRGGSGVGGSVYVPVQIALTLALVVAAAALGATVAKLRSAHLGFHTEGVFFVPADFERLPQKGPELVQLYNRMAAQMEHAAGVESVSVAENVPLSGRERTGAFANHVLTAAERESASHRYWVNDVGAEYFRVLGTLRVAGSEFTEGAADARTCMLNRSAASSLFAGRWPLGRLVWQGTGSMNSGQVTDRPCRVVGVVEDAKYASLRQDAPPTVYYPFGVETERLFSMNFVIHAASAAAARSAYETAMREMAPGSPQGELIPFAAQFEDSIARERVLSVLSGFFAGLTLLLSGIGVYGLMESDVAYRRAEIGVRMALGATRGRIFRLVMGKAARLLAIGVLAGSGLALLGEQLLQASLFGVGARDPALFGVGAGLLLFCGCVAAGVPAWQALRTEPVEVLRQE